MKEFGNLTKILIEGTLYLNIKLLLESQYHLECMIDNNGRKSNRLVLKDRQYAIKLISEAIEKFTAEKNLDKEAVQNFLLQLIQNDLQNNKLFENEYRLLEELMTSEPNQE